MAGGAAQAKQKHLFITGMHLVFFTARGHAKYLSLCLS